MRPDTELTWPESWCHPAEVRIGSVERGQKSMEQDLNPGGKKVADTSLLLNSEMVGAKAESCHQENSKAITEAAINTIRNVIPETKHT